MATFTHNNQTVVIVTYRNAKVSFKDSGDKVTMTIEHGGYIFEETYSEEELAQNPLSKEDIECYIDQFLALNEDE